MNYSVVIHLWFISLTASKELSILLLKLLECMEQWYIGFLSWTLRPEQRLIASPIFAVFDLCRLNCHPVQIYYANVDGISNEQNWL